MVGVDVVMVGSGCGDVKLIQVVVVDGMGSIAMAMQYASIEF